MFKPGPRIPKTKPTNPKTNFKKGIKKTKTVITKSNPVSNIQSKNSFEDWSYGSDWAEIKRRVKKRDNFSCQECGKSYSKKFKKYLHVHHVVPISKGGTNKLYNLITLCVHCHRKKHPHMKKKEKIFKQNGRKI